MFRVHRTVCNSGHISKSVVRCLYSPSSSLCSKRDEIGQKHVSLAEKHEETGGKKPGSQAAKLAKVFAKYGTTAVVFHTCISLTSLGLSYTLVSSGIDVNALLQKLNLMSEKVTTNSQFASGASTFVIAYAFHKVFMPARIFLTVTATPLVVRKLTAYGILKPTKTTQ